MREWLIKARNDKGLSQAEMCRRLGVSQPTYWEYEHGQSTPRPPIALKIGRLLDIDWTQFYQMEETVVN